jgi:hypothetical protein
MMNASTRCLRDLLCSGLVISFLSVGSVAFGAIRETGTGMPAAVREAIRVRNFEQDGGRNEARIRRILELEAQTDNTEDAIAIKTTGLRHCEGLKDYALLCSYAWATPTDSYKEAVSAFLVDNIAGRVKPGDPLHLIQELDARSYTITGSIKVKTAGLALVQSGEDYLLLVKPGVETPSTNYVTACFRFMLENLPKVVKPSWSIASIRKLEGQASTITDSIAIKTAGLVCVHTLADLPILAAPAIESPSNGYKTACSKFLLAALPKLLKSDSNLEVVLKVEAGTEGVPDAIAVKTAGLIAVHNAADFAVLTRYAFPNPPAAYKSAVARFIAEHGDPYIAKR